MADIKIKQIIEAALLAAGRPLTLDRMLELFLEDERPERSAMREAIDELREEYVDRSVELLETGAGFRINVRSEYATWVSRLWEERPPRYSRAMLETLSLIAYRQPITRGEIEDVRGVSVSSSIVKTLMERSWIREVGHRDVPGRPALLATTKEFLNYFGLKTLNDLPTLAEIKDMDSINCELDLGDPDGPPEEREEKPAGGEDKGVAEITALNVTGESGAVVAEESDTAIQEPVEQDESEHE
ncbi:MAG: SMC-Scp complex subunit ScpB [Gammaproteobacteria bacterium]|nr:SMC-Scp complex subunit ScpB [Gammaproteobacteria bacterium]